MDEPTPLVVPETGYNKEEEKPLCLPLAVEKKLKFYEISWIIDDFYIQSCQENWKACSPELGGPQKTKLQLFIKRASNQDTADIFSFTVKRLDSDLGPETVWVNLRVEVSGPKYILKDKLVLLNKGTEIEANFAAMDSFFDCRGSDPQRDAFDIECKMVIYTEDEIEGLEFRNASLKSLSEDLLALFESGLQSDMELKFRDYSLPVHRAILYNHVAVIRELMCKEVEGVNKRVMPAVSCDLSTVIKNSDCEAMRRVMAFIYSGNLKHVLEKPSISIHDWALNLDIKEILDCYAPETLIYKTPSNVEVYECNWPVDFPKVCENEEISHSEILRSANSCRTWQFHMYLKRDADYVVIVAQTNEEIKFMNMCFKVSVTNEDERLPVIHILRNDIDGCKRFEFDEFLYKNWMLSYKTEGINLAIKLQLCRNERGSSEIKPKEISRSIISGIKIEPYKMIRNKMKALFEDKVLCDGIIQSGDLPIYIHKFILASRCSVLYDSLWCVLFYRLKTKDSDRFKRISSGTASKDGSETRVSLDKPVHGKDVPVSSGIVLQMDRDIFFLLGIEDDVLNSIIRFIYTGEIYFGDKLVEVYKAARELKLPQLEEACAKILPYRIKKDESLLFECLIAAADMKNNLLEAECIECLRSSGNFGDLTSMNESED